LGGCSGADLKTHSIFTSYIPIKFGNERNSIWFLHFLRLRHETGQVFSYTPSFNLGTYNTIRLKIDEKKQI
jgi:hypothetical protein